MYKDYNYYLQKYKNPSSSISPYNYSTKTKTRFLENKLQNQGIDVPSSSKRGLLDRISDALGISIYPIMSGIKNAIDNDPNTTVLGGAWEGIKSANPFGQDYTKGEVTGSDVLETAGWKRQENPQGKWYNPLSWNVNNTLLNTAGFAGDVLLDPATYLTGGAKSVIGGAGKTLLKQSAKTASRKVGKELAEKTFKEGIEKLGKKDGLDILRSMGLQAEQGDVQSLIKKLERLGGTKKAEDSLKFGIGKNKITLANEEALRRFGDKTGIAPLSNLLKDKAGDLFDVAKESNVLGGKLSKGIEQFTNVAEKLKSPSMKLKDVVRKEPETAFKQISVEQFGNLMKRDLLRSTNEFISTSQDLFKGFSYDDQKFMTDTMEELKAYQKSKVTIGKESAVDLSDDATTLLEDLKVTKDMLISTKNKYSKMGVNNERLNKLNKMQDDLDILSREKATWKNKDFDHPVTVTGYAGEIDGKKYFNIEGSQSAIPKDELKFDNKYSKEIAKLKSENEKLLDSISDKKLSENEIVDEIIKYDQMIKGKAKNEEFVKLFKDTYKHSKIETVRNKEVTDFADRINANYLVGKVDDPARVSKVLNTVKTYFDKWQVEENISNPIVNYVTHMLEDKTIPLKAFKELEMLTKSGKTNFDNVYDRLRKFDITIKDWNKYVGEIESFDKKVRKGKDVNGALKEERDLLISSLQQKLKMGDVDKDKFRDTMLKLTKDNRARFEHALGSIFINRGLSHNALVYEKKFVDTVFNQVGTKVLTNEAIVKGKLYASTEDVINTLRKNELFDEHNLTESLQKLGFDKDLLPDQLGDINTFFKPMIEINKDMFARFKAINKDFSATDLPEITADYLIQSGKTIQKEDQNVLLDMYDKFLRLFKINATIVNPGFHGKNMISNQFQNYLSIGSNVVDPRLQALSYKILSGKFIPDELEATGREIIGETLKTAKGNISYSKIKEAMEALGISGGRMIDEMKDVTSKPSNAIREITEKANKSGLNVTKRKIKDGKEVIGLNPNVLNPLDEQSFLPYQIGTNIGSKVENHARAVNFIAHIIDGKDFYEAAEQVNKFLFDYNDLSGFERKVMKRIIPFYTWMRKNVPLQLDQLFNNTNAYRNIFKAEDAIRDNVPEDERLPDIEKNEFAKDWIQLKDKVGDKPVFLNPNLPVQDLEKLDIGNILKTLTSSSTPLLKIPTELAMNRNLYFDSPIKRGETHTEDAPNYVQLLLGKLGKGEDEQKQIDPKTRYLLRNIVSAENISKLLDPDADTRNANLINILGGIKTYPYDSEKYSEWAYKDRLAQLRKLEEAEKQKRKRRK